MFRQFTASARLVIFFARYEALAGDYPEIRPGHLALAIRGLHPHLKCPAQLIPPPRPPGTPAASPDLPMSAATRRVLQKAADHAQSLWRSDPARQRIPQWFAASEEWRLDPRHILLALLEEAGDESGPWKVPLFGPDAILPETGLPAAVVKPLAGNRSPKLDAALLAAEYERRHFASVSILPEHLLLGLVYGAGFPAMAQVTLQRFGPLAALRREVGARCRPAGTGEARQALSPEATEILERAAGEAARLNHQTIGTGHLLIGLLALRDAFPAQYLARKEIYLDAVRAGFSGIDL